MELEIVEAADDRYQIVDRRGRIVSAFASPREADSFVQGYKLGREDASNILRGALEPIAARVAVDRS